MRLADPGTLAAADATMQAARARYGPELQAITAELKTFLAGRKSRDLAGEDAVRFLAIKARFDAAAIGVKHFAEANLAHRLDPGRDGSETVDA